MASITFALNTTIERCNMQHHLDNQISYHDFRRWEKGPSSSMENFRMNYSLASDLNGGNHRVANAFVATVFKAYCDHYPLELSVDDFWLTIIQGIGVHVNQNAEKYRSLLVFHDGKKQLTVSADDLRISELERPEHGNKSISGLNWEAVVGRIAELIRMNMKTDLASLITKPFSTTKPVEQAVFDCALMDIAKAYFNYGVTTLCGIPEITLRGSPDDFQQKIDSINQLKLIFTDFHWWFDAILPHIQNLRNTAAGKLDCDWWSRICHRQTGSGVDNLIVNLFHYECHGNFYPSRKIDLLHRGQSGIDFKYFAESITNTAFTLNDNGVEVKMKLIAGFFGISQNSQTGALRPSIGWVTAVS